MQKKSILREIAGLEKERARIASDLHDELGPLLSAVKMKINSFDLVDQDDHVQLERTNSHIDDILKRMREISFDLIPNALLKKGFVTALREYVEFLNNENSTQCVFINESAVAIGEDKSVNIYRIVQEVINNSLKHAHASEIIIKLYDQNNKIHLSVGDNGKGFNYKEALERGSGIGLTSLKNRAEIAGGKMFVTSSEKGTLYLFEIPL